MSAQGLRWVLAGSLLVSLCACEVSVGECDRTDAGDCVDLFPDIDSGDNGGSGDGGTTGDDDGDASIDGGTGGGGDDGGSAGTPLTRTEFCEAQLAPGRAWADLADTCCASEASSDAVARLLAVVGYPGGVADCESNIDALLVGGAVSYKPDFAAACAAAFASNYEPPPSMDCPAEGFLLPEIEAQYGHGAQVLGQIPACRATFAGTVALDAPCTKTFECADADAACRTAPGDIRTCQPALTGGPCEQATDCAFGYICKGAEGNRVCVATNYLGLNDAKCKGSAECAVDLWCNPDPDDTKLNEPFACTSTNLCNPGYEFCDAVCVQ